MAMYICVSIALKVIFLWFSDWYCQVQNLRRNKTSTPVRAGAAAVQKKILGVLVDIKLNTSQCCALVQRGPAASYAALGNVASRLTELILAFCSGLLRPYLEYCVQQWAPQQTKAGLVNYLKDGQAASHIQGKAARPGIVQLEEEKVAIINMYEKYLMEQCKEYAVRLFSVIHSDRTAGKN